jgi:citrate synthase
MDAEREQVRSGLDDVVVAATELSLVDGDRGRLVYRGHDAIELAETRSFEEVWHLLGIGHLPSAGELPDFSRRLRAAGALSRAERAAVRPSARGEQLAAVRTALSELASVRGLRPWLERPLDELEEEALSLAGAMPSLVALVDAELLHRRLRPGAFDGPSVAKRYLAGVTGRDARDELVRAFDRYLVLAADHGMNASTFVARSVASTGADVGACLVAALAALSGPLHGGAPAPVLDMLDRIGRPARAKDWIARRVEEGHRIMGFGHRVYRTDDPRALSLRRAALNAGFGRAEFAAAVEQAALEVLAELKPGRPLRTNVEFWSAVTFEACGIPRPLFTATFATSRIAGWTAHLVEQARHNRLVRPKAAYVGPPAAA